MEHISKAMTRAIDEWNKAYRERWLKDDVAAEKARREKLRAEALGR